MTAKYFKRFVVCLLFTLSFGCASTSGTKTASKSPESNPIGDVLKNDKSDVSSYEGKDYTEEDAFQPIVTTVEDEVLGKKLKVNTFDLPVVVNKKVERWIKYFQGRGKPHFQKYLERARYFIPEIAKVLKENDMPQDLVYLAMIESGFNNSAKSHARAVGPWQFIRYTGKRYGLTINYWQDQRRNTIKSTHAAIGYLRVLYREFGTWELAAAGYNAGEGKVRRAIRRYRTYDFWEIAKRRFLRRETRNYVPKMFAAAIISKNPEQFGFIDTFKDDAVINPTTLITATQTPDEIAPKRLGEEAPDAEETSEDLAEAVSEALRAQEKGETAEAEEGEEEEELEFFEEEAAVISKSPEPVMTPTVYRVDNPDAKIIEFEVKGPADLFAIAKAAGLPYSTIKALNPELLRWCTPPNMETYKIRIPDFVKDRFLATYNDSSFDRSVVFLKYKAKRGDSISRIARRYKVSASAIRDLNGMRKRANRIKAGKILLLPLPTGYKRFIAGQYDDRPVKRRWRRRRRRKRRYRRKRRRGSFNIERALQVKKPEIVMHLPIQK